MLASRIRVNLDTNEDITNYIKASGVRSVAAKDYKFQGLEQLAAKVGAGKEDLELALPHLQFNLGIDGPNRNRTQIPFQAVLIGLDDAKAGQLLENYSKQKGDLVPKDSPRKADPLEAFALELAKSAGLPDGANQAISFGVINLDDNQRVLGETITESIAAQIWSGNIPFFPEKLALKAENLTMTNTTAQKMRDEGGAAIVVLTHPVLQTSYVGIIRTPKTEKIAVLKDSNRAIGNLLASSTLTTLK